MCPISYKTNSQLMDSAWLALLDTVIEGVVVVDGEGTIRHINQHAAEQLALKADTAAGKHFRDVFCPSLPMDQCWVMSALAEDRDVRFHHFKMTSPGQPAHVREIVANLTRLVDADNSAAGALISLRVEGEDERLREIQEKQDAILGSISEGLFTVDAQWRITSFNRAAEEITGWSEQEVLGRTCKQVFESPQCLDNCPLAETLKRRKPILDFEMELRDRLGRSLPVSVNTAILHREDGEALGGVVSFRNYAMLHSGREDASTDFCGMVGKNKRIVEIYQLIRECADSKATVLILGESGTGKELVARAVYSLSSRKGKPYVRVNCAAIPDTLLESELFGHVRGAFTDAHSERVGRFGLANRGTIFLDEVGDLTPPAQLRLLRVLEEGEFQRLGSSETTKVNVRVIAATNRDLWQMVQRGNFRDDLFYRLNVIPITLPPLRQRMDDFPYLIEHFMEKYRRLTRKPITEISDRAFDIFTSYDYPGNIRELENIIEHAFVRTRGNVITENKLPLYLRKSVATPAIVKARSHPEPPDGSTQIRDALVACNWNRQRAAMKLGISRTTLWRRLRVLDSMNESEHARK